MDGFQNFLVASFFSAAYLLVVFYISIRKRDIFWPIMVGGAIRFVFAWIIGLAIFNIPGTTDDARSFEMLAREWSALPWPDLLAQFDPSRSYVISWIGAIIYKLTVPSPVVLNLINAMISVLLIVYSYKLADRLWGNDRAKAAAWIIALFPFAILYGSVFRREVFGSLLFMFALLAATKWARKSDPISFLWAMLMLLAAGTLHSGYALGAVGLILFAVGSMLASTLRPGSERNRNIMISGCIAIFFGMFGILAAVGSGLSLNKIGEIGSLDVAQAIEYRVTERISEGGSGYPSFLVGADPFSNPLVIVGRFVYFLLSPFPWDIRSPTQIIGFFATAYFSLIMISVYRSRFDILKNRAALVAAFVTFSSVMVFAISIDNIGTSIRHRTKFIYPLAALCFVPLFERIKRRRRREIIVNDSN